MKYTQIYANKSYDDTSGSLLNSAWYLNHYYDMLEKVKWGLSKEAFSLSLQAMRVLIREMLLLVFSSVSHSPLNYLTAHALNPWWRLTCFTAAVIVSRSRKELLLNAWTANSCWSRKPLLMCTLRAMMSRGTRGWGQTFQLAAPHWLAWPQMHAKCIMGNKQGYLPREAWTGHTSH